MKPDENIIRAVAKTWKSQPTVEGAGVHLERAFGFAQMPQLDPFLLLDAFRSENPEDYKRGFPWHPHRGIETITYLLDGEVEHGDSLGNRGLIAAGDVQWMTAGSGIIHQEMPRGDGKGQMWGFQLWANLPARDKMMAPRYRELKRDQIPRIATDDGVIVRVVSGTVDGVRGPVREIVTDPDFFDVSLPAGKSFRQKTKPDYTVFAYVTDGEGYFDPSYAASGEIDTQPLGQGTMVLYGAGDELVVTADKRPVRFLLVSGRPLKEPIAWHGPIVMNTQAELRIAFEEYQRGTFVKHGRA
jgi:redox-sensitive bicupin YhaK (pirin superfamily)